MNRFFLLLTLLTFAAYPANALADDYGGAGAVRTVSSDARRLLAARVRANAADPKTITVNNVTVIGDRAVLSWGAGNARGFMGLRTYLDRWWDALDATPNADGSCWHVLTAFPLDDSGLGADFIARAAVHNGDLNALRAPCKEAQQHAQPAPVRPQGGLIHPSRDATAGYDVAIAYAANNARPGTTFARIYGRSPTKAEMISNPAPPHGSGGPTDVFFFDLALGGSTATAFSAGTRVDVWFPFVLDDSLQYRLSFISGKQYSPPIRGTVFDNTAHFELPAFTIPAGDDFEAQIEAFW